MKENWNQTMGVFPSFFIYVIMLDQLCAWRTIEIAWSSCEPSLVEQAIYLAIEIRVWCFLPVHDIRG